MVIPDVDNMLVWVWVSCKLSYWATVTKLNQPWMYTIVDFVRYVGDELNCQTPSVYICMYELRRCKPALTSMSYLNMLERFKPFWMLRIVPNLEKI